MFGGATGTARAPKPDKTPIHSCAPPLQPPRSILQNPGKTTVLPVLQTVVLIGGGTGGCIIAAKGGVYVPLPGKVEIV